MSRTEIVEWVPACEPCASIRGRELQKLGPTPHPCRACGTPTRTAVRVVR